MFERHSFLFGLGVLLIKSSGHPLIKIEELFVAVAQEGFVEGLEQFGAELGYKGPFDSSICTHI